jgi:hypothetical protein
MEHKISVPSFARGYTGSLPGFDTPGMSAMDVRILKGVVSKDHVHLHLSYPPKVSVSDLVKRLKGR